MSTNSAMTIVSGVASLTVVMHPLPLVILGLDAHNFSQWNIHLRTILDCHGLLNHIDGSLVPAPVNPI
jgi:hypothetical protein